MIVTVIVTGGAGFIGSNFIFFQLENHPEDRIVCVDKLSYAGNIATLKSVMNNSNFRFIKADISDKEAVESIFGEEHPDIVVNFAAETHVDRSIDDLSVFLKTNVIGTQVLMDACRKYNVKRFHQVSTDEVYGDLPIDRTDLFFTECTGLNASSPYSASKASADLIALSYFKTFGLPVTITRCSNNYGFYQFPEKLIPLAINRALENKKIPVYGNGENVRDWLFVEDHCSAIDLVMRKGKTGEVYNIGGHNEQSNIEVIKVILNQLGRPETLVSYIADRPGHDRRYAIDSSKIQNELGWKPKTEFQNGIRKTIEWYLNNRDWLKNTVSGGYNAYFDKMYSEKLSE